MNTIRLFDRNFNYIFSTFGYQKLQASLKYYGKSNLAVEVNANSDIAHFLQEGIYLTFDHKGKQYPFVVKRRTVNNDTLTAQAVSPHDFFARRITIPPEGSEAVTSTGSPDKVIKDFIRSCITGSRALPFSLSADRAGAVISEQSRFQNLASEVERICAAYGIGESFELDETDCCVKFDTYTGTDRTQDNTEDNPPCIFAAKYKNLSDYLYDWDGSTRQTTAIVGGQGEGIDREIVTVGDNAQGVDRYEVFVDARDVNKGNTELLTGRGLAAVTAVSETITTEESQTGNLVFGEDYFLGDLVTVRISVPDYQLANGYYDTVDREILINQRITEVVITVENGTYSVDLQYGDQQFTKNQTLIQDVDKLKVYANTGSIDYIVECGTSGIWTYEKWASGKAECWGQKKIIGYAMTKSGTGYYYGAAITENYPFTFNTITFKNTEVSDSKTSLIGVQRGTGADASLTQIGNTYPLSPVSQTVDIMLNHHVKGTWK